MDFLRSIWCISVNFCLLKSPKSLLYLAWYSQTQFFHLCQRALVESEATYRYYYKNSKRKKVISVLETLQKTQAFHSISDNTGIIIKFENLKARFGLKLSSKDYADHKGVDA